LGQLRNAWRMIVSFTKRQMEENATEYENFPTYIPTTGYSPPMPEEERAALEAEKERKRAERRKELYRLRKAHKQHVDVHYPCQYCYKEKPEEYMKILRDEARKASPGSPRAKDV